MKLASAEAARALGIVAALIAAQVAIAAFYWIPDARAATALAPTGDVLAVVLVAVAWSCVPPSMRRLDRVVATGLPLFVLLLVVVALGQGLLRREFGQDLLLVIDVRYVSSLVKLLFDNEPLPRFTLWTLLALVGLSAAVAGPYRSVRALQRYGASSPARKRTLVVCALVAFAVPAAFAGVHRPVAAEVAKQLALVANWKGSLQKTARRLDEEAAPNRALVMSDGAGARAKRPPHIFVFVVESYGQVIFSGRPGFAPFVDFLTRQRAALARAGYQTRTKYMRAPVFGSGSWMSDATLACGVRVDNQKRFAGLFESDVRCLPKILQTAGYRTVLAAANTEAREPRFARTYAFDEWYFKDDFKYAGPRFGWSLMPDQFVIDFVHHREVATHAQQPLFVEMVLTSSHVPWSVVPPIVDWGAIGDGALYGRVEATRFGNWLSSGQQYEAGYVRSIEYSLQSIADYLERLPLDDRSLVIVLGDHQPRTPIGDRFTDPWWVPVHVLGRDAESVERFAALGYEDGLVPATPESEPPGLERLMPELLQAIGASAR